LSGQSYNYSHNVTIEDNIFNGTFDATVVAIRSQSSYNLKIIGCRGEGLFSLGQITSIPDELEVRDCDVTVSEGGINYTGAGNVTIEALKVVGELYGVRAGANNEVIYSGSKLVISGSDLEAKYPVIIRGAAETVTITDSTLTPIDDGEMINNVANGTVNITIDEAAYVTSEEELKTALANTSVKGIILGDDIELTEYVNLNNNKGLVLDGNGQTITTVYDGRNPCGLYLASDNITIKNVTITGESKVGIDTKRGTKGLSIIDVTFKGMGIGFYANPDVEGTIEKCIFEYLGTGIGINGSSFSTVDNSFSNIRNMYLEIFGERTEEDINEILGDNTFDSEVEAVFEESKWTIIAKTIKNNNLKAFTMGFVALEEETQTTAEEETLDTVSAFNEAATEEEENAGEETEAPVNEQEVEEELENIEDVVGEDAEELVNEEADEDNDEDEHVDTEEDMEDGDKNLEDEAEVVDEEAAE